MTKSEKKVFVVGDPIDHSRSPLIHRHWLDIHNLSGSYERVSISSGDFPNFFDTLSSEWIGGNITIPHKEAAFTLVDESDDSSKRIGAINTVWLESDRLYGCNTDGYGFLSNLDDRSSGWDSPDKLSRPAIILGAGGASRAIIDALQQRGFTKVIIMNRTYDRAVSLSDHFACEVSHWGDVPDNVGLLVNTTSLGMNDNSAPDIDLALLPSDCLVTDLVYTPQQTKFLNTALEHNLKTVDGLGMLLHQAVFGFEKWFGVRPSVTQELRNLLLRDLGEIAKHRGAPKFLGITGSIGMGKTTTASMFSDLGIPICDLDSVVHDLYRGEAVELVESAFPGTTRAHEVDRVALSKAVVGDDNKLKELESILRPLLDSHQQRFRDRVAREGCPLAIFDSPLLFEQGMDKQMDLVLVATAPSEVQRERVLSRKDMSVEKFESLLSRQWSDERKRENANYIVDTSLGFDSVRTEVGRIASDIIQEITSGADNA